MKTKGFLAICLALLCLSPAGASAETPVFPLVHWRTPNNEAMRFMAELGCGWNLGNALECYADEATNITDELELETLWSSPEVTREMLGFIRSAGYTSIRIPVSWHDHMDADLNISGVWMDRVQTVVDWALELGFYVILDSHHDIGPELIYPTNADYDRSAALVRAIWTGICERFQGYNERLIFQGLNEPRLRGTDNEWLFEPWNPVCTEAAECINRLNQEFVDVVRASGGANASRYLIISPYANSPLTAAYTSFQLPKDTVADRLIVSIHCYLPHDFCMDPEGTDYFDAEDENQTSVLTSVLDPVYDRFVLLGIPVILDEFGSTDKNNLSSRVTYTALLSAYAKQRSMPCFLWDNNQFWAVEENYGVFDRWTLEFVYPEIITAQLSNGQ